MTNLPQIIIYTDGACSGNPGPGGWGAILYFTDTNGQQTSKEIYGSQQDTTNNQMELKAAIEALSCLKKKSVVKLYTDSIYVKNGISSWIFSWKKNNWRNSSRKPVKNVELWKELDELTTQHDVNWHWVKGHSGNEGNEKADMLACKGKDEAISTT